jgi:hypothetical protein
VVRGPADELLTPDRIAGMLGASGDRG